MAYPYDDPDAPDAGDMYGGYDTRRGSPDELQRALDEMSQDPRIMAAARSGKQSNLSSALAARGLNLPRNHVIEVGPNGRLVLREQGWWERSWPSVGIIGGIGAAGAVPALSGMFSGAPGAGGILPATQTVPFAGTLPGAGSGIGAGIGAVDAIPGLAGSGFGPGGFLPATQTAPFGGVMPGAASGAAPFGGAVPPAVTGGGRLGGILSGAAKLAVPIAGRAIVGRLSGGGGGPSAGYGSGGPLDSQINDLLELSRRRSARTEPVHEAAMQLALRMAPGSASSDRVRQASEQARTPPPGPQMSPAVREAVERLMRGRR